ncbi:MAG: TIGR00153 family protein [Woeseia sp.]|nr:TIGR00153 family protein [Woeseia sp.]|tara:strand:+ start:1849 stop:2523 length:675 start_codon:yes stop_codon:yes gene_type:complete
MGNVLGNIFGSSPIEPLEKHVDLAYQATKVLNTFFDAVVKNNWEEATSAHQKIIEYEQNADELKKEIRLHLPRNLFMPVPREDVLELLLVQDRMANRARDVAGLVLGRSMAMPEPIAEEFLEFVRRNVDAAKQARKSVRELDELFTSGFRGAEVTLVERLIEELDKIESDSDSLEVNLRASLFAIEEKIDPVSVIFLYRIIELTGEIADMAERVGRRLEILYSH